MRDLRVVMPNRPGMVVRMWEALDEAGIDVQGACGDLRPGETWGIVHILVDDYQSARKALDGAGFQVSSEHDVEVFEIGDNPGATLEAVKGLAEAGDNIEVFYVATRSRLVVGTESMRSQRPGIQVKDT